MKNIKVESQWNDKSEIMLNIPHFPHLHAGINKNFAENNSYPHPYQYFLASLAGIITMIIIEYSEKYCLLIINLYITVRGEFTGDGKTFKKIDIEIRLNINASPAQFTELQKILTEKNSILSFFKNNIININWD
ncbi:MAG: OsmC family protein [bacterium]